jgi:hypothetical protein
MKRKLFACFALLSGVLTALALSVVSPYANALQATDSEQSFTFDGSTPIKAYTFDANGFNASLQQQAVNAAAGTYILFEGAGGGTGDQTMDLSNSAYFLQCQRATSTSGTALMLSFYFQKLTSLSYVTSGTAAAGASWLFSLRINSTGTSLGSVSAPGSGSITVSSGYCDELQIMIFNYAVFEITSLTFHYHC